MKVIGLLSSALIVSKLAIAIDTEIRGVEPSRLKLYDPIVDPITGKKTWRCLNNPEIILSYDQINDDYCDCPDGSDEPGTNACPYNPDHKFYCANKNHIPGYIENYKLNDGVCDYEICCDGSDEYLSGKCEDKCKEINHQFNQFKQSSQKDIEKSLKLKSKLEHEAASRRLQLVNQLESLNAEKLEKEEILANSQDNLAEEENGEEGSTLSNVILPHLDEISVHLSNYHRSLQLREEQLQNLEKILAGLTKNYNPNFNDIAVKESVNKFQEYVSNKEEALKADLEKAKELLRLVEDHSKEFADPGIKQKSYEPPTLKNMILHYFNQFKSAIQIDENVDVGSNKKIVNNAQAQVIQKELEDIDLQIEIINEDLEKDYGPGDILRAYKSTWVEGDVGGYNYKLGFLDAIYQDDVLIGKYADFKDNQLFYKGGAKCWNGPHRSATIDLTCGSANHILSVSEPQVCKYLIELVTPLACKVLSDEEILSNFKIDRSKL
ncbi:glucosidase II beta subunit-like-domain-containing protein [Scheffersomyces coipomensis]|uniref:glucosidase II beta subunit-like-domain-containing protein n=1 Tax=Scheffersomyces coipomensis TaxID=1788519 RepID=UPI00315D26BB